VELRTTDNAALLEVLAVVHPARMYPTGIYYSDVRRWLNSALKAGSLPPIPVEGMLEAALLVLLEWN
jgi:hypothetical protein